MYKSTESEPIIPGTAEIGNVYVFVAARFVLTPFE